MIVVCNEKPFWNVVIALTLATPLFPLVNPSHHSPPSKLNRVDAAILTEDKECSALLSQVGFSALLCVPIEARQRIHTRPNQSRQRTDRALLQWL